jgi:endonuclease/exonuclease/phosphatase family metal-dependent hydrolase
MARILTYNVHRWMGTDRQISPLRVADVIASCEPDIVALQEVRVGRSRPGALDQAALVAARLGMELHFQPTIRVFGEQFGIAVLTRLPSRLVHSARLPSMSGAPSMEKRSALWVSVAVGGVELQVVNTHLSLRSRDRLTQAEALVGPEWLGHPDCRYPAVLLGDFNAPPQSRTYRLFANHLGDAQKRNPAGEPEATFHTRAPVLRLDHVFVSDGIGVVSAAPVRNKLTKIASDHFPLLAELRLVESPAARTGAHAAEARASI